MSKPWETDLDITFMYQHKAPNYDSVEIPDDMQEILNKIKSKTNPFPVTWLPLPQDGIPVGRIIDYIPLIGSRTEGKSDITYMQIQKARELGKKIAFICQEETEEDVAYRIDRLIQAQKHLESLK